MNPKRADVFVAPTRAALMEAAAGRIVALARRAMALRGRFTWVLAGGSTPRDLYLALAGPPFVGRVDWSKVHFFWGDERCVPPDHPDSNYRMARESLLDAVAAPAANVHRMRGEDEPQAAAAGYERGLREFFQADPDVLPRFDLVLLGMGADGHTASLFPGSAALDEKTRWVAANWAAGTGTWRLTLTFNILNASEQVLFLVAGGDKARRLKQVVQGGEAGSSLPAQRIRPVSGALEYLVDAGAAAALDPW